MEDKETSLKSTDTKQQGKMCAILAYLLVGIIWYFADEKMKKNKLANFHVKQALVLVVASLVGNALLFATLVFFWLIPLFQIAVLVFVVMGIINANNEKEKELPIIGQFAKKLTF